MATRIPLDFDRIRAFGVQDIRDIADYNIAVHDGQTIHTVTFTNGGSLVLAFADRGGPFKANTDKLDATISSDGRVLLAPAAECAIVQPSQ